MRSQSKAILVGGLLIAILGFAFHGSMGDQNRELYKAQVQRAQAEARWLDAKTATERQKGTMSYEERLKKVERAGQEELERRFAEFDEIFQRLDEQGKRLGGETQLRLQHSSEQGGRIKPRVIVPPYRRSINDE